MAARKPAPAPAHAAAHAKPQAPPTSPATAEHAGTSFFKRIFNITKKDVHGLGNGAAPHAHAAAAGGNAAHKKLEHKPSGAFAGAPAMSRPAAALAMGFGLVCCPLTPEVYEEAWFKAQRQGYVQQDVSRLYREPQGVLADPICVKYLEEYIGDNRDQIHLVRFWRATQKFATLPTDTQGIARLERAVAIYRKYLDVDSPDVLPIASQFSEEEHALMTADVPVLPFSIFRPVQRAALAVLAEQVFPGFLVSHNYLKYCLVVLTSGNLSVEDVLLNDTTVMLFMEFLERDGVRRLVQFWLAAYHFRRSFDEAHGHAHLASPSTSASHEPQAPRHPHAPAPGPSTPQQLAIVRADAMALYSRYFSLQAEEPLGVDEATRVSIEANICIEGGPRADCFARAQHLAHTALNQYYLPLFRQSDLFYKYLDELVHACEQKSAVAAAAAPAAPAAPESASSTSATDAQDDAFSRDVDAESTAEDQSGRPLALRAPRREISHTLGVVDEYGVYITATEEVPVGEKAAKAAAKHRKDSTKAEQEMALQVAQMILSDVYSEMREQGTIDSHLFTTPSPSS